MLHIFLWSGQWRGVLLAHHQRDHPARSSDCGRGRHPGAETLSLAGAGGEWGQWGQPGCQGSLWGSQNRINRTSLIWLKLVSSGSGHSTVNYIIVYGIALALHYGPAWVDRWSQVLLLGFWHVIHQNCRLIDGVLYLKELYKFISSIWSKKQLKEIPLRALKVGKMP